MCSYIYYSYTNDNNINSLYIIKNNATAAIAIEPKQLLHIHIMIFV